MYTLYIMYIAFKTPNLFLGENPCNGHDMICSHLCLIGPGGESARCECPDHFIGLSIGFKIQCVADCSSTQFRCGDNEKYVHLLSLGDHFYVYSLGLCVNGLFTLSFCLQVYSHMVEV